MKDNIGVAKAGDFLCTSKRRGDDVITGVHQAKRRYIQGFEARDTACQPQGRRSA